jgi:hypothetical protein
VPQFKTPELFTTKNTKEHGGKPKPLKHRGTEEEEGNKIGARPKREEDFDPKNFTTDDTD